MSGNRDQVIFQLGDLHFPDFESATTQVDNHDARSPGRIQDALGLPVPHAIREALVSAIAREDRPIVVVCGDLTTRGNRGEFVKALDYLHSVLSDARISPAIRAEQLHIVPGNHDVDFKGDQKFESFDDVTRFTVLSELTRTSGLGDVMAVDFRTTATDLGDSGVVVMSINTCRGSGATRRNPPGAHPDVLLETVLALDGRRSEADVLSDLEKQPNAPSLEEVLDVPFIHPTELSQIASTVAGISGRHLPVVVAHHGLLPQHTPRLNPYTEMANAGQVRRELSKLKRPILYLHGHVHAHSIETVFFPTASDRVQGSRPLVIVAAPELVKGFNKITIRFDADGYPLGIKVAKYRIRDGDQTVSLEPDITTVTIADKSLADSQQRALLEFVLKQRAVVGSEIKSFAAESPDIVLTPEQVESFIEVLWWQGVLDHADNVDRPFDRTGFVF